MHSFSSATSTCWHINCNYYYLRKIEMKEDIKRLLIIEPDDSYRTELADFFRENGFSVETGQSLTEALRKITDDSFSCMILAIELPEMKGYEAISILKNLDPHLKIIMMTERNTKELEAKVREQDIFYYFIRSFGKEELKLAINNVFRQLGG